jgi:hypothetical protein
VQATPLPGPVVPDPGQFDLHAAIDETATWAQQQTDIAAQAAHDAVNDLLTAFAPHA